MKVLHITNNYPLPNFPIFGIFVKEQINSLANLDINNDVFFINGRENGKLEYLKSIFRIKNKIKNNKYDIIHCHHALSALCLILSGKSIQNKVLVSFQNDPKNELGSIIFRVIKFFSNGCIFKNNSSFVNDNFSFYLPNGVNTNFFKPIDKKIARLHLGLKSNSVYILFVSSNKIRQQKRYDRFLKTIEILKNKYKIDNIEIVKLVNVRREEVPYYFNAVDLHLLTSDFEGSPNSVKESIACNTPVVSTNVGNVCELLKNANACYVSNSSKPEKLAFYVNKSLGEYSNNGVETIKEMGLDIESVALNLKNIYSLIINKN